jgi:hypothetical protein
VSPGGAVMYSGVLNPEATSSRPTLAGPNGNGVLLAAGSEQPQSTMVETAKTNVEWTGVGRMGPRQRGSQVSGYRRLKLSPCVRS